MSTIHVLVQNKLIALDGISPLLLHIKSENKNINFNIITFDEGLVPALENNIVLRDIVDSLGKISYVGKQKYNNKFISNIVNLIWLLRLTTRIILTKETLIHSGMINAYPLKLLYLVNKKNTFICDKVTLSALKEEYSISEKRIYEECTKVAAHSSISFSENSLYHKCKELTKSNLVKKYEYHNPKKNRFWINYINKVSDKYIDNEMSANSVKGDRIITYIASRFGVSTHYDKLGSEVQKDLIFFDILVSLSELSKKFPIAIKGHIYSDLDRMNTVIRLAKEKTNGMLNCYVTKLHPSVLAKRSVVGLSHLGSTTFYDFRCFDVPTIAVTDYKPNFNWKFYKREQIYTEKFIYARELVGGCLADYIENLSNIKDKEYLSMDNNNNGESSNIISRLSH